MATCYATCNTCTTFVYSCKVLLYNYNVSQLIIVKRIYSLTQLFSIISVCCSYILFWDLHVIISESLCTTCIWSSCCSYMYMLGDNEL